MGAEGSLNRAGRGDDDASSERTCWLGIPSATHAFPPGESSNANSDPNPCMVCWKHPKGQRERDEGPYSRRAGVSSRPRLDRQRDPRAH